MSEKGMTPARPMRILHTESSWGWGGQELRILTESTALISRGHSVAIAAPPETPLLRAATERGIETIALPIRKKRLAGLIAIRKLLQGRSFDVVNTHSSTDAWLTALACTTLSRPPKIVRTRHVSTPVRPSLANRWLFGRACAAVVTTGEAVRDMLIRDLKLDPARIVSVPTGVDSNLYRPASAEERVQLRQKLGVPLNKVIVGTVATLRFLKGIEYLFEAIRLINDDNLFLCVVGDGPQRQRLEGLIQQMGLTGRIMMAGEQHNVPEWLQTFDIFAFPSLAEGVPQALAQAMLTELPCVTTSVGGIPELARDLETAILCQPSSGEDLKRCIRKLLEDQGLARKLGRQAREHCLNSRSIDLMARVMEERFLKLVAD